MGIWKVWNESILEQFDEQYELNIFFGIIRYVLVIY